MLDLMSMNKNELVNLSLNRLNTYVTLRATHNLSELIPQHKELLQLEKHLQRYSYADPSVLELRNAIKNATNTDHREEARQRYNEEQQRQADRHREYIENVKRTYSKRV